MQLRRENYLITIIIFMFFSCNDKSAEFLDLNQSTERIMVLSMEDLKSMRSNDTLPFDSFDTIVSNVYSKEFNINASDSLYLYYYEGVLKQLSQNKNTNNVKRKHIEFRENGNLYFIGEYIGRTPEGIFSDYDSLGILKELSVYIKGEEVIKYEGDDLNRLKIDSNWRKPL